MTDRLDRIERTLETLSDRMTAHQESMAASNLEFSDRMTAHQESMAAYQESMAASQIQFSDRLTAYNEIVNAGAVANQRQMEVINQAIADATVIAQRIGERADARLQQHDLESDDHDVRIERLERDHTEHADRMAKMDDVIVELKDVQKDIREILQMMTRRLSGE